MGVVAFTNDDQPGHRLTRFAAAVRRSRRSIKTSAAGKVLRGQAADLAQEKTIDTGLILQDRPKIEITGILEKKQANPVASPVMRVAEKFRGYSQSR